jgi:hypothetical protein
MNKARQAMRAERLGLDSVHAGVVLCDSLRPISDLTGIAQTLSIIKMIDDLLSRGPS